MKKIFITQRLEKIGKHQELRDNLDLRFSFFFQKLNMLPIIVPNNLRNLKELIKKIKPNGILLSPGGSPLKRDARFNTETFLIKHSKKNKIPILGICRGAQALNLFCGGRIIKIKNHVRKRHKLFGKIISLKNNLTSYCFHEYGIKKNTLGKNLIPLAFSEDGSIECFKHLNGKIMGIMWHPERKKNFRSFELKIIKKFF